MKKAQGLSWNMIALAAILLVVVVVVLAIFYGIIGDTVPFFKDRTQCGGQTNSVGCVDKGGCDGTEIYGLGCPIETAYCCIKDPNV